MSTFDSEQFQPKELQGSCILGAITLPDPGFLGGKFMRHRVPTDDSHNGQNLQHHLDYPGKSRYPEVSQRLRHVLKSGGGLICEPNFRLGAPMCTFVYGGISPGKAHSMLDLIQGPAGASNLMTDNQEYKPVFSRTSTLGERQTDTADPITNSSSPFDYPGVQFPQIPSFKCPPFNSDQINTTYNIWRLINLGDGSQLYDYTENLGPAPKPSLSLAQQTTISTHPSIRQVPSIGGGMMVSINAINGVAQLERVFPISKDLAYNRPLIYYPKDKFADTSSRYIEAKGGENCGFQLHLHHTAIGNFVNSNNDDGMQINGSIKIEFGAPSLPTGATVGAENIVYYQLILTPDRVPELFYYHPYLKEFRALPVSGRAFGQNSESTSYSIYVHFAGPVMMVGFGSDINDWNVYNPIEADEKTESRDKLFFHRIPENSTVRLTLSNVACSFEYGPIAFNSYHRENVDPVNNTDNLDIQDLPYVVADFRVPEGKQKTIEVDLINTELQDNAFINPDSDEELLKHSPTYYGDWRSQSRSTTLPELYYTGTTSKSINPISKKTEYDTRGKVRFNTTIEGPLFFHVRNSDDDNRNKLKLVTNFQGWGDLSDYMTNWTVNCESEGSGNLAFLKQTAQVTLVNLASSKMGRRILDLIKNNLLVVTIGGGFDDKQVYFQGVIETQKTVEKGTETVTTLYCKGLQNELLEGLTFPQPFYFGGARYQDAIQAVMDLIGLTNHYILQSKALGEDNESSTGFKKFQQALSVRASLARFNGNLGDLTDGLRDANIMTPPLKIICNYLQIIIDKETFPVMFYDPLEEKIKLNWRQDPGLVDALQFLGTLNENGQVLIPNSTSQYQHGVLKDAYEVFTNNRQLHAGMIMFGQLPMSQVMTVERRDPSNSLQFYKAISPESLDAINDAILNDEEFPDIAYVGYRKFYVDTINSRLIHSRSNLQRVANSIEPLLQSTYENITFSCYVTKPLKHMGRFTIDTFIGENRVGATDYYIYKQVTYSFDKNANTITADIEGVRLPSVQGVATK